MPQCMGLTLWYLETHYKNTHSSLDIVVNTIPLNPALHRLYYLVNRLRTHSLDTHSVHPRRSLDCQLLLLLQVLNVSTPSLSGAGPNSITITLHALYGGNVEVVVDVA